MEPLPLTPFEELMLWEDRPAYPFSIFAQNRWTGRIDREAWEQALRIALPRHPLLQSRIRSERGRLSWNVTSDLAPVTWREVPGEPTREDLPPIEPLNLFETIGLRTAVVVGAEQSLTRIQFHHACCDGAGYLAFFSDLLVAYAEARRGMPSALHPRDADDLAALRARNQFGLTPTKLLKMLPRQLVGLKGARQFLMRKPVPLVPHAIRRESDPPPPDYPANIQHAFSSEDAHALRMAAQRHGVTLNELLTRDLFLALFRWREEGFEGDPHSWIRMMVPVNLRTKEDRLRSAANVVSSIFLDRKGIDANDPGELLTSIHDELELIKNNQLGLTFQFSLRVCRWMPGGIRKSARNEKCGISCVFTNAGKVLSRCPLPKDEGRIVAADLRLDDFQVCVPFRPHSVVTFGTFQYARQLFFGMHYDPGVLSESQARQLMDRFVEATKHSAAATDSAAEVVPPAMTSNVD